MLNNKYEGNLEKIQIAGEYAIEVWKSCGMDLENVEFIWAKKFYEENPSYWGNCSETFYECNYFKGFKMRNKLWGVRRISQILLRRLCIH